MFFPALKKLKDSNKIDSENLELFDSILNDIYEKEYQERFSPNIYKYFNEELNESEWITFLEKLCEYDLMQINFELCCPDCDRTISIFHEYNNISLLSDEQCSSCFNYIETTLKDIFITYSFNSVFKPNNNNSKKFFRNGGNKITDFSFNDYMFYPAIIFERIINERKVNLKEMLEKAILTTDKHEKGKFFEDLAENLLDSPYLKLFERNKRYSTGEIDIIFEVAKIPGTIFQEFSDLLISECKNWEIKVGSDEIEKFYSKMGHSKAKVGIFFSKRGITGNKDQIRDAEGLLIRKWDSEKKIMIIMDYDDLNEIILGNKNLYNELKTKYYEIKTA